MWLAPDNVVKATPLSKLRQVPVPFRFLLLAGLGSASIYLSYKWQPSFWSWLRLLPRTLSSADELDSQGSKPHRNRATKTLAVDQPIPVSIFWDVDNCSPATGMSGRAVAQAIRSSLQNLELGPIVNFKAYLELSSESNAPNATQVQLRSELQGSGVSLIDTPKSGRKDVADKMMITDLLAFAIDQPAPATIVLISGDRDFAYPLGLLRNRGYEIVLIVPPIGAVPILEASANLVLTWRQDVLGIEKQWHRRTYANNNNNASTLNTPNKTGTISNQNEPGTLSNSNKPSPFPHAPLSGTPTRLNRKPSSQSVQVFQPLISLLNQLRDEGNLKPLRAAVATRLFTSDRNVFTRAGASRWAEYAAVAEAAGIIKLGSLDFPGSEWVSLKEKYQPTSMKTTAAAAAAVGSAQPSPATPLRIKATSTSSTGISADLKAFYPLIEVIKERKSQGDPQPLASYVGTRLTIMARQGIVDAYAMAGVSTWREYIALADQAGVARTVPTDTDDIYIVKLHPKYFQTHTNQITSSVGRIVDTAITSTPLMEKRASPTKRGLLATLGSIQKSLSKSSVPIPTATTTTFNGHQIPARFFSIAQTLLEQMNEGRYYSTDYFLHSILGSSRATHGLKIKHADEFQQYLQDASENEIITTTDGFNPEVKHIRLHPRLVKPSSSANSLPLQDESSSSMGQSSSSNPFLLKKKVREREKQKEEVREREKQKEEVREKEKPKDTEKEIREKEKQKDTEKEPFETERPPTKQLQDNLENESDVHSSDPGSTNPREVATNNRVRFKILIEILVQLRSEERIVRVTRSRLSSEISRRNPGPGDLSGFYQRVGSTGPNDYLVQAERKGFVLLRDQEGHLVDTHTATLSPEYFVELPARYVDMFFGSA